MKLRIPVREPQQPVRGDYRNSFEFCTAERDYLGDAAFKAKYNSTYWGFAFVRCVWQNY